MTIGFADRMELAGAEVSPAKLPRRAASSAAATARAVERLPFIIGYTPRTLQMITPRRARGEGEQQRVAGI
jgi:hypothetical protein